MAPIWRLAIPPPSCVSLLLLLGLFLWRLWLLFSGRQSREQEAAKRASEVCDATFPGNPLLPVPASEALETPTSWARGGTGWGKRGVETVPMDVFLEVSIMLSRVPFSLFQQTLSSYYVWWRTRH